MDSMRNMSTSLPNTRRRPETSDLLADFRAAALSVTNLYKTAAASHTRSKESGYQDALDDLLAFLDKENLGLMDGEGWRVRRWATERLTHDGGPRQTSCDEDDEPGTDQSDETRTPSGEATRKAPVPQATSNDSGDDSSQRRAVSEQLQPPQALPTLDNFQFRSQTNYPTSLNNRDDPSHNMELDSSSTSSLPSSTSDSIRVISRPHRGRHTTHNRRGNVSTINLNLGAGAGAKRKSPHPDFFDLAGFNISGSDKTDGNCKGGKKGRQI